jgi:hypothetical protein
VADLSALPEPPAGVTAGLVLARVVDSLGFRHHWATEGLRPEDVEFRPVEDCMSVRQLEEHLFKMLSGVDHALGGPPPGDPPADFGALRAGIHERIASIRARLAAMSDADLAAFTIQRGDARLPIWNLIHGPLADALTHVGQINICRRVNGNPVRRVNYFLGKPA